MKVSFSTLVSICKAKSVSACAVGIGMINKCLRKQHNQPSVVVPLLAAAVRAGAPVRIFIMTNISCSIVPYSTATAPAQLKESRGCTSRTAVSKTIILVPSATTGNHCHNLAYKCKSGVRLRILHQLDPSLLALHNTHHNTSNNTC